MLHQCVADQGIESRTMDKGVGDMSLGPFIFSIRFNGTGSVSQLSRYASYTDDVASPHPFTRCSCALLAYSKSNLGGPGIVSRGDTRTGKEKTPGKKIHPPEQGVIGSVFSCIFRCGQERISVPVKDN